MTDKLKHMCSHCGEMFDKVLGDGNIPTHDFPRPCRAVCPGSHQPPRFHGTLVADLKKGCVYHGKRWTGDVHADKNSGQIAEEVTNHLMAVAAKRIVELEKWMEEYIDMSICKIEGAASELRSIVGYPTGPYPDIERKK